MELLDNRLLTKQNDLRWFYGYVKDDINCKLMKNL